MVTKSVCHCQPCYSIPFNNLCMSTSIEVFLPFLIVEYESLFTQYLNALHSTFSTAQTDCLSQSNFTHGPLPVSYTHLTLPTKA